MVFLSWKCNKIKYWANTNVRKKEWHYQDIFIEYIFIRQIQRWKISCPRPKPIPGNDWLPSMISASHEKCVRVGTKWTPNWEKRLKTGTKKRFENLYSRCGYVGGLLLFSFCLRTLDMVCDPGKFFRFNLFLNFWNLR